MNDNVRIILEVLGDGGTTEMANRILVWLSGDTNALGVRPEGVVGRAEIATELGVTRIALAKLIKGDFAFPAPFRVLDGDVELYDLERVRRWAKGNPDLVGDRS